MTTDQNAKTTSTTIAPSIDTFGALNQHPTNSNSGFTVGVTVDRNKKCRRTMEDAHSFIYDFGGIRGQGYFAVFDGHAGKHAAEWCGEHFHQHLLEALRTSPSTPIPDLLNATFHKVDTKLSHLAASEKTHSGCTAVTVFLRLEDEQGNAVGSAGGVGGAVEVKEGVVEGDAGAALQVARDAEGGAPLAHRATLPTTPEPEPAPSEELTGKMGTGEGVLRSKIKDIFTGTSSSPSESSPPIVDSPAPLDPSPATSTPSTAAIPRVNVQVSTPKVQVKGPAEVMHAAKRTLYTANVGDARAVLSRGGRAIRLTYDHKGTDAKEAKRITDAGGFVMNNRVNGVLAVTRSLGDSSMKEFVVGSPYTTETTLGHEDEFLIVACDGLWDVCEDQQAVELIKGIKDAQVASKILIDHALTSFSTDNLSVLVVKLNEPPLASSSSS